jgi:hypothetical protein
VPQDFNGASLAEVEDEIRYQRARGGDHLCCPFQCPNCQSQNTRGRDLMAGRIEDEGFMCLVVRATLDAFWARSSKATTTFSWPRAHLPCSSKTILTHGTDVNFILRYAAALDISRPFPSVWGRGSDRPPGQTQPRGQQDLLATPVHERRRNRMTVAGRDVVGCALSHGSQCGRGAPGWALPRAVAAAPGRGAGSP